MRGKKICATILAAVLCLGLLTGCSTNAGEHISTYFTQMSNVVTTAIEAQQARAAAESGSSDTEDSSTNENALATPTNFTVDEDGNYSFDAVENAVSYYLYIYEDAQTKDATYSMEITDDGSDTYTGNVSDVLDANATTDWFGNVQEANLAYGTWSIRVVAIPDYENTDYTASGEAKCDYMVSGEVEYGEPTFCYMWSIFGNELTIKVDGMNYSTTAYPTSILLTLTNTADSGDVVTIEITDVSSSSVTGSTEEVSLDATYSISAEFTWGETYVSNPSYTTDGGTAVTSSEENLISGEFYYSSDIFNSFDFPHVYEGFDPEAGGSVGVWYNENTSVSSGWGQEEESDEETDTNAYFEATPIEANDGALYSYDIVISSPCGSITATPRLSPGSANTEYIYGTLDLYEDGTFTMEIEYQYISTDMMNASVYYVPGVVCNGVYTTNSDGTLNLSYDHENASETDYDIVTELTGKAAEVAAASADSEAEMEESAEAEVMPETDTMADAETETWDGAEAEENADAEADAETDGENPDEG